MSNQVPKAFVSGKVHRLLFYLVGLLVFAIAFLVGRIPPGSSAAAAGAEADDASPDENLSLPPEIRSRLAHIAAPSTREDYRPAVTFWEVLGKVKTRYVDKITDQDRLSHGAAGAMLRALRDPYSRLITADELQMDQQQAAGDYSGVGVILGARLSGNQIPVSSAAPTPNPRGPQRRPADTPLRSWQLVVVDTVPGSPAAAAGVETGDIVSKIDGDRIERPPLATKTIDDLNAMLNGPAVHDRTLSIVRPSTGKSMDFRLEHGGPLHVAAVESRTLPHAVAYARIRLFTQTAPMELASSLSKLASDHPTSLILDLRDNPGGLLSSAQQVIGILAPKGAAAILDGHEGAHKLLASTPEGAPSIPSFAHVVVLTDSGTASVAEMVAGALRERRNARLLGAPTFGNGLVQTIYPMGQGWAFGLTTGRLRTPSGVDFNEHGLAADRTMSPGMLEGDAVIQAAVPIVVALNEKPRH